MFKIKNTIGILAVAFIVAVASIAFAHDVYSGHMMGQDYYGGHMMGYGYHQGPHMYLNRFRDGDDLSAKDKARLNAAQEQFFKDTQGLREKLNEKRIALRNEMAKENTDKNKAIEIQKQISGIQSELDQKAVSHQLEVRKLLPENFDQNYYGWNGGHGYLGYCR